MNDLRLTVGLAGLCFGVGYVLGRMFGFWAGLDQAKLEAAKNRRTRKWKPEPLVRPTVNGNGIVRRNVLPLLCLVVLSSAARGQDKAYNGYEFPAGVPLRAGVVKWYDPTDHYQHGGAVHSRTYNISAVRSEPFGNANREFPWKTGGLDNSPNGKSYLFHQFPPGGKIAWWREPARQRVTGSTHWTQDPVYRWRYPVGTIFGEALLVDGETFEVRVMTRGPEKWKFQVYRPFATVKDLEGTTGDRKRSRAILANRHPNMRIVDEAALIDNFTMSRDDSLSILSRPFKDVTGVEWDRTSDGLVAYCPTASKTGQIVPVGYSGHFFGANTCVKCHATVGESVSAFEVRRDWYGSVRGSDSVFSYSIFDDKCAARNGFRRPVVLRRDAPLEAAR